MRKNRAASKQQKRVEGAAHEPRDT